MRRRVRVCRQGRGQLLLCLAHHAINIRQTLFIQDVAQLLELWDKGLQHWSAELRQSNPVNGSSNYCSTHPGPHSGEQHLARVRLHAAGAWSASPGAVRETVSLIRMSSSLSAGRSGPPRTPRLARPCQMICARPGRAVGAPCAARSNLQGSV